MADDKHALARPLSPAARAPVGLRARTRRFFTKAKSAR